MKRLDLNEQHFGRLIALKPAPNIRTKTAWHCKCECGKTTIVLTSLLRNGHTKSCSCLDKETRKSRARTHGLSVDGNGKRTRLYGIWNQMKNRCLNPNDSVYIYYGARGITICDEWLDFSTFYEWAMANGYRDDLTIDRIEGSKDYEPSNCRWATSVIQNNNNQNNRHITFRDETKTLTEWAKAIHISASTLHNRLRFWPIEKALTTPRQINQYKEATNE